MNSPFLLGPDELETRRAEEIGGKAFGLIRMLRAGLRVPPFRVIPPEAAAERPWHGDEDALGSLRDCFAELAKPPHKGVAVRSSAMVEDQAGQSCAGVFETRFVDAPEGLVAALDVVVDSLAADDTGAGMAVVVQAGVEAEVSGVLFSVEPGAAQPHTAYVEAVTGPGAKLVDGTHEPTRFYLDYGARRIARVSKGADGPDGLDEAVVANLFDGLDKAEAAYGRAVDMEWCLDRRGLWFVQCRPITALSPDAALKPSACATSWFFDQRFFEPIRPITRTTLLPLVVDVALAEALAMRGTAAPEGGLQFYGGQAYVSHACYCDLLEGAPRWLMSGDLRQLFPKRCLCEGRRRGLFAFLSYASSSACALLLHWREGVFNIAAWDAFQASLPARLAAIPAASPRDRAAWEERWAQFDTLTTELLRLHRWSVLWANTFYGFFRRLLRLLPEAARARVDARLLQSLRLPTMAANAALGCLLRGETDVEGFKAAYGHRSVSLDYAEPTWAELADSGGLDDVYGEVPRADNVDAVPGRMGFWLRPLRRLLEMREEQRFAWERILARQRAMLVEAGQRLAEAGKCEAGDVWFFEKDALLSVLFDESGANREAIRVATHTHYVERGMSTPFFVGPADPAAAIGERALRCCCRSITKRERENGDGPRESVNGDRNFLAGLAAQTEFRTRPAKQGQTRLAFAQTEFRTRPAKQGQTRLTRGLARLRQSRFCLATALCAKAGQAVMPEQHRSEKTLRGLGASPGTVSGVVRVLSGPEELGGTHVSGVITVLRSLDPAWTPLLPGLHGLIVERGGLLSHGAILAREYGVPMVIGVEDAARLLRNGMHVSMDGSTGVVHVDEAGRNKE